MKSIATIAIVAASLAVFCQQAQAQSPAAADDHVSAAPLGAPKFDAKGMARTETIRNEFDSTREVIQVRADFAAGASVPKHSHPGVEIAYVLNGVMEYELNGKTVRLKAGESIYIPTGAVHSAKNVDSGITSQLSTYLVEKNKPIVILDK